MKRILIVLITILFCGCIKVYGQPTLDTLSVVQADSISRAFYTFNINVFGIKAPATLDTAVISIMTSNELTDSTFADYNDMDGNLVTITLVAGDYAYLEPNKFFALLRYIKIKQHKVAAAQRLYTVSLGRY